MSDTDAQIPLDKQELRFPTGNSGFVFRVETDDEGPRLRIKGWAFIHTMLDASFLTTPTGIRALGEWLIEQSKRPFPPSSPNGLQAREPLIRDATK